MNIISSSLIGIIIGFVLIPFIVSMAGFPLAPFVATAPAIEVVPTIIGIGTGVLFFWFIEKLKTFIKLK